MHRISTLIKGSRIRWIGPAFAAAGLAMMGYGICRGEVSTVFTKAVNICLECIGIG